MHGSVHWKRNCRHGASSLDSAHVGSLSLVHGAWPCALQTCCIFFFPTGLFIVQTQSWVGQTSSGGWAVLWSNPPPRNHSSLPSPLKPIVLPSSLVCIGTQWLCTWPLCFCGFSATSNIAMLLSCLLMYSPVAQELSCIIDSKIQVLHSSCTSLTVKSNLFFALNF